MYYLLYVSRETCKMDGAQLREILTIARQRNKASNISGMLLYKNGRFMQLLEGPKDAVRSLMDKVILDQRHQDLMILEEDFEDQRQFPDWAMAFKCMDDSALLDDQSMQLAESEDSSNGSAQRSPRAVQLMQFFNVYS